ncbi:hypothetical protein N0V88_001925 [Collariella sp. IMI 366227]|nr:hypothetical protein N0V88_001925 [Collariella sp. IMI 366227]
MATATGTELARPTFFTPFNFTGFPFELRHLIWGFALPDDDEPEVLILEAVHVLERQEDGGTEPMVVDTAFPALMHVCRESRNFVVNNAGRFGIQFRDCPVDAAAASYTISVPCRPFRPELDTIYWNHAMTELMRHGGDDAWLSVLRHLALASPSPPVWLRNDMPHYILTSCPELRSLSVVVTGSSDDSPVREAVALPPKGRRCKLRPITPGRAQAMMVVCDVRENGRNQREYYSMDDYMAVFRKALDNLGYGSFSIDAEKHFPETEAGGGGGGGQGTATSIDPDVVNKLLSHYLLLVLGVIGAALLVWRITTLLIRYVRTVTSLHNDTQRYFAQSSENYSWFKKNIMYAPILSKRHNREFQLSSALNVGTLPTRMQLLFLIGYFATNVAFCVVTIDYSAPFKTVCALVRNRTGYLAVVNMIPLFLMAGRNNPLINLLGMSFDTFNLLHRWLGRIVMLESVAHTLAFLVSSASAGGWSGAFQITFKVPYLMWGFIATCAFVALCIQASSIFRHAYYETFKLAHIALAILSILGLWYHLDLKKLPQIKYLYAVVALWAFDRLARLLRLAYRNLGAGGTKTLVEALPGGACRVTVTMARPWAFKPGQHAYLYMPTISFWQSHPFTVAWSDEEHHSHPSDSEKGGLPMNRTDILARPKTTLSFIIRGRTGFTGALHARASARPDGKLVTRCLVEGPYRGSSRLHSYGTVMLFAGGVGITQAVPHVRDLVAGYANGTVATRKVILVWTIQSPEHLEWIRPWMTEVLAMEKRREVLKVLLFVSRPRSTKEIHSPSATVQMFPGRPSIETLVGMEMEAQVGTMAVTVCGPGALSDDVRRAVGRMDGGGAVEFVEEAFSW